MKKEIEFRKFKPAVKKNGPVTSKIADDKATKSGAKLTHCQKIYNALLTTGYAMTCAEIARFCGLDYVQVARRMIDLEIDGLAQKDSPRSCAVKKCLCTTWSVKKFMGD